MNYGPEGLRNSHDCPKGLRNYGKAQISVFLMPGQDCTCVGPPILDMTEHGASAKTDDDTGDTSEPQASKRDGERQGEEDGATADASSSLQHTDANRDDSAMRC